ncbi:hypothetical protein BKA81DRAFT_404174 [Phyllosticta paracitricarpa]|uniref:Uncharacterized protein n=1 Tax=Phyllosticta paracitricarpa TaxID=2016321 RepID=A0ABR1N7V6_9PEZI
MFRLAAGARPCVGLPVIKPPGPLRPSFALVNTFAVSRKLSSNESPAKGPQFFDENGKKMNHNKTFRVFERTESRKPGSRIASIIDPARPFYQYMHYEQFSQVATMHFVRTILKLPVPKAQMWSNPNLKAASLNRADLMDFAKGNPASSVKKILQNDVVARTRMSHHVWLYEKRVSSFVFDRYGSLYRPSSDFMYEVPRCHKARVLHGASPEEKRLTETEFYIGPSCEKTLFQGDGKQLMEQHHGPWTCATDYVNSLLRLEIEALYRKINGKDVPPAKSDKAGISYEYYIELLERALSIVPYIMPKDSEITSPRLHHPTFGIDDVYLDE